MGLGFVGVEFSSESLEWDEGFPEFFEVFDFFAGASCEGCEGVSVC